MKQVHGTLAPLGKKKTYKIQQHFRRQTWSVGSDHPSSLPAHLAVNAGQEEEQSLFGCYLWDANTLEKSLENSFPTMRSSCLGNAHTSQRDTFWLQCLT